MSIDEAKWVEQLHNLLEPSDANSIDVPEVEAMRSDFVAASSIVSDIAIAKPIDNVVVSHLNDGIAVARPIDNITVGKISRPIADDFVVSRVGQLDKAVALRPVIDDYYQTKLSAKRLYLEIDPVPAFGEPVRVGDFLLFPDVAESRVFFTLAVPRLVNVNLTVQQENCNGTIKVTGGMAVLTVSVYEQADMLMLEKYRQNWTQKLAELGYSPPGSEPVPQPKPFPKPLPFPDRFPPIVKKPFPANTPPIIIKPLPLETVNITHKTPRSFWRFQPLNLRNLRASLEISANHLVRPPEITTSTDVGTVTFLIELSELGVQVWQDALTQRRGDTIPGICRLSTNFYAQMRKRFDIKQQALSVSLGVLLAGYGLEVISIQNPKISLEAKLIITGHPTIESVVIDWQPNAEGTPGQNIFSSEGGQLPIQVVTNNVNAIEIGWNAKVNFRVLGWPLIPESGKLSFATNNFVDIIKPTAWIRNYDIIAMLIDDQGNIIPSSSTDHRLVLTLTYNSPSLQGLPPINTTFETSSQKIVTVLLPVPNPQLPAELAVTVTAMWGASTHMKTRKLQLDETSIIVTIYPSARIEVFTNLDTTSEVSVESEMLSLLTMFSSL
jgi:hypothetical protein